MKRPNHESAPFGALIFICALLCLFMYQVGRIDMASDMDQAMALNKASSEAAQAALELCTRGSK